MDRLGFASVIGLLLLAMAVSAEDGWGEIESYWHHEGREAQRLLETTPDDDWWARASLTILLSPHPDFLLEWESLSLAALQENDLEMVRAAVLLAPEGASEQRLVDLYEAWMLQDPENIAPALYFLALAGADVFSELGDASHFERYDVAVYRSLSHLVNALPEGVSLSNAKMEAGIKEPQELVWFRGAEMLAPVRNRLPCLDIEQIKLAASLDSPLCLIAGQLMETTATSLSDNLLGVVIQRDWHDARGNEEAADEAEKRRDEIIGLTIEPDVNPADYSHLASDLTTQAVDDADVTKAWRSVLVEYGDSGALRWMRNKCAAIQTRGACIVEGVRNMRIYSSDHSRSD